MNTENKNTIRGTFNYYLKDEQAILDALKDKNIFNDTIDIVNTICDTRTLKHPAPFVKVNGKCLSINMILLDGVTDKRLTNIIKSIDEAYDNLTINKCMALGENCNYKFVLYSDEKKKKPVLVLNLINPLLQQYDLIP